jgi:hypothetical protein
VSLEAIVAIHHPEMFAPEDINVANQTLGIG